MLYTVFHHCTRTVFDILDAGAGAGESEDEDEDEEGKKKGKKKGKGKAGDESGEDEEDEDGKSKKKKKKGDREVGGKGKKGKKGTGASDIELVPFDTIGTSTRVINYSNSIVLLECSKRSRSVYHFHFRSSYTVIFGFCEVAIGHLWL